MKRIYYSLFAIMAILTLDCSKPDRTEEAMAYADRMRHLSDSIHLVERKVDMEQQEVIRRKEAEITSRRHSLASLAGTNRTYIYDALRECAGKTPVDFINGFRLRYAANLLATSKDSVSLIAELCGLSRRTFYRLFEDAYSMSPSDYRKVAKK